MLDYETTFLNRVIPRPKKGFAKKSDHSTRVNEFIFSNDLATIWNLPVIAPFFERESSWKKLTKKSQKWYFFQNPELNDHLSGKKPFSQNHKGILQFWSLKRSSAKGVPFAHFHRFRHNSTARCYSSCGKRFQKKTPKHGLVSWNYDFKRVEKEDFRGFMFSIFCRRKL